MKDLHLCTLRRYVKLKVTLWGTRIDKISGIEHKIHNITILNKFQDTVNRDNRLIVTKTKVPDTREEI